MPANSVQLSLIAFETTLLFAGAGLLIWVLANPRQRQQWLGARLLPHWPVTLPEFLFAAMLVFASGFLLQASVHALFNGRLADAADRQGLELAVYGAGFHFGILLGCALFSILLRRFYADYGTRPAASSAGGREPAWLEVFRLATGTVLVVLPVLTLLSLGWTVLLRASGVSDQPQDLIGIFAETQSPLVIASMLVVACVLAPLSEELMFRAGLYRYLRQRLGRMPALLLSSVCFGALHGNWAGFLPLAVLGMILAVVYEATGSIRVVIVAHSLFNLNTILVVISGLHELGT
jgi:uncharacterized protein